MKLLYIPLLSVGSFVFLFLLAKLMGHRQMSQLSMFDYIVGISIGSIAAEMATSLDDNFLEPLIAMTIYAVLSVMLALLSNRSHKARKLIEGEPIVLFSNGKLYKNSFKKAKLDLDEFLAQCRINGYFSPDDLNTVILEPNGRLSFLPAAAQSPLTPQDMNIAAKQKKAAVPVIMDGKPLPEKLKSLGFDEIWLRRTLKEKGVRTGDIFLATSDIDGTLCYYEFEPPQSLQ